jgi:hypothetical protein
MSIAPEDQQLREAINQIVYAQYRYGEERILFLGPRGELRDVLYPSEGSSALHAKRVELLSRGELGAVVHLSIADYHGRGRLTMVEVIGDDEIHTLASWPSEGQWIGPRPDAQERWHELWGEEEDQES